MKCPICSSSTSIEFSVKEMMLGTRDTFLYTECAACGCLRLVTPPPDMSVYYPSDYYSLTTDPSEIASHLSPGGLRTRLAQSRDQYAITGRGVIGRIFDRFRPNPYIEALRPLAAMKCVTVDSRILDVGCGSGEYLFRLRRAGFRHLSGVDPYLPQEYSSSDGLEIRASTFFDVKGKWDVIMFHHSFEHVSDHLATLQKTASLLSSNGVCLIRMPIASSFAWRQYREYWAQIDAPRHYVIHTEKSIRLLANKAGLFIGHIHYDSNAFQFWASEEYRRDIPLSDARAFGKDGLTSLFSPEEITSFSKRASELNSDGQGDQAAFVLRLVDAAD